MSVARSACRFVAWLLTVFAGSVDAQALLTPVDEAAMQPDFFSFRAQLAAAVARRDAAAVLAAVDEQIRTGFGGDDGRAAFERQWDPGRPDSRLWEALGTVLALGGSFTGAQQFSAPYVYSRWPEDLDAFEHVAVVASDARLRGAPRADAQVIGRASFVVLELAGPATADGWFPVCTPDGRTGYLARVLGRSPLDYRAIFERRDGRWQLVAFVSGD